MKIPITYCGRKEELDLPDSCHIDLFLPPEERLEPINERHWLNSGVLPDDLAVFLESSDRLLIVVNDRFRPTPTGRILKAITPHLIGDFRLLVATGLHPEPPDSELKGILGETCDEFRSHLTSHNAFNDDQLVSLGIGDKKVRFGRLLNEHDYILIIGSVEPHYFAGFTGGRKIILPGCASFEDVRRNHAYAVSPLSQPLATNGNPVWDDIQSRSACLNDKKRFAIQVVCSHQQKVFFVAQGDWDRAHQEAREFVTAHFAHAGDHLYDAVISVVYPPLDRNLYQLQKSYENVAQSVRDGGTVLLISGCREGVGDERFIRIAETGLVDKSTLDRADDIDVMGIHKVTRTLKLSKRINLALVSTLDPQVLSSLPIVPKNEINRSLEELIAQYGKECSLAVVLDSASQVLCRSTKRALMTA